MKIPRPGSHALLNTFHREIIVNAASPNITTARTVAIPPSNAAATVPISIIAPSLMFHVNNAHESSKEKFIFLII